MLSLVRIRIKECKQFEKLNFEENSLATLTTSLLGNGHNPQYFYIVSNDVLPNLIRIMSKEI